MLKLETPLYPKAAAISSTWRKRAKLHTGFTYFQQFETLIQVQELKQTSLKVINALNYNNMLLPPPHLVCNDGLYRTAQGQRPNALLNINHGDFSSKI